MKFRKEKLNKMKLGDFNKRNHDVKLNKQVVAYDTETTYGSSLLPTVTVSSKAPLSTPCDSCHRKVKRLFSLTQQGLTYFVCHNCYEKKHKKSGEVISSFVDPTTLEINPKPRIKWSDICTTAEKFAPRLHKARKINRKNKKV